MDFLDHWVVLKLEHTSHSPRRLVRTLVPTSPVSDSVGLEESLRFAVLADSQVM